MRLLTPQELTEEFNTQKEKFRAVSVDNGVIEALGHLSQIVDTLRQANVDISLDMIQQPSELAFGMFPRKGKLTVPSSGILKIGTHERLIAISVQQGGWPCLKIAISDFDMRHNGAKATHDGKMNVQKTEFSAASNPVIRSTVYDLKMDPDALVALQKDLILDAARLSVIADADSCGVFENTRQSARKSVSSLSTLKKT